MSHFSTSLFSLVVLWLSLATAVPAAVDTSDAQTDPTPAARAASGIDDATASLIAAMAKVGGSWSPSFSPDGRHIAFISTLTGVPQVWVMPTEGGFPRLVTSFDDPIQEVEWSPEGDWLAFQRFPEGALHSQVYLTRPDGVDVRRITPGGETTNWLGHWSHDGKFLTVSSSQRDPSAMDNYVYDVASGELRLVVENPGIGSFTDISDDGRWGVLYRLASRGDDNLWLVDFETGREVLLTPHEPPGSFSSGEFSPDARTVYLSTNKGRDRVAFGRVRIDDEGNPGPIELLAARPDAELQEFELTPDGKTAALVWNVFGRSNMEFLDLETMETTPGPDLPAEIGGDAAFSHDGKQLAIVMFGSAAPPDVWIYRLDDGSMKQLTRSPHPGIDLSTLVQPEPFHYEAPDGLELSGWLYRPRGAEGPTPTVLVAHGGPESQERPSFLGTYQSLVKHGMTVFAPNFRGSAGFGKEFVNLDNQGKRFQVIQDIKAGVDALVREGIADPDQLGIFGFSYGGWVTMATLVEHPDLFEAAAVLYPIVNFETFFANTEPWMAAVSKSEYGDPDSQADLLRRLSPIHRLHRVRTPTIIFHGANDTNVPVIEAEQIEKALREGDVPVDLVVFPDEGHGFEKMKNRVTYAMGILEWFDTYLLSPEAPEEASRRGKRDDE